jgi:moderate conductance mechanosensitive channel
MPEPCCRPLRLLLIVSLLFAFVVRANAQPTVSPPAGMTEAQFSALVEAISNAVVEKLKKEGAAAPKPLEPAKSEAVPAAEAEDLASDRAAAYVTRARQALIAFPELGRNLLRVPALLDESARGGRSLAAFLVALAVAIAAALGSEVLLRRVLNGIRLRLASRLAATTDFSPLIALACLDVLGVAAVWLVSYGLIGAWFPGSDGQARLAAAVLSGIFYWRLYMLAFQIFLRPRLSAARLVKLADRDAWDVYWRVSAVILSVIALRIVFRILVAIKTPPDAIAAWQVLTSFLGIAVLLWAAWRSRLPVTAWFSGMIENSRLGGFESALARHWFPIAAALFFVLFLAQLHGAVTQRFIIAAALLLTLNLLIGLVLFESLLHFVKQRLATVTGAAPAKPRAADLVARCIRVGVYIAVAVVIAESWIVEVFGFVDSNQWRALAHEAMTVGGALFAAYVGWEAIHFLTDSYIAQHAPMPLASTEDEGAPPSATRLATLMPLMRMTFMIVIFVIAALVVLSELGVNTTPLIAGASVFGLALSFGSQTLVRDIVSGVFYLADDAFRVGEYIDSGKAKGTVEGFTLRSIRLRHQNGQLFTIPFGQLGQITNFSRDWTTMKFNLRFARDTDVEKLRKTVKKVGLAMMEEPEFKDEFLQPLKLQGVADVLDNALVMRFKFTVKPNIPTVIQREAMKRLFRAFQTAGIEFASATVSVQTVGSPVDRAVAAAGASAAQAAAAQGQAQG